MPFTALVDLVKAASLSSLSLSALVIVLIVWIADRFFRMAHLTVRERIFRHVVVVIVGIFAFVLVLRAMTPSRVQTKRPSSASGSVTQAGSTISQSGGVNVNGNTGTVEVNRSNESSGVPKRSKEPETH
jgi:hypothetical protein